MLVGDPLGLIRLEVLQADREAMIVIYIFPGGPKVILELVGGGDGMADEGEAAGLLGSGEAGGDAGGGIH